MEDAKGQWRTVGGRKIFIGEGQTLSDAMAKSGKFDKENKSVYSYSNSTGKTLYIENYNGKYKFTDDIKKALTIDKLNEEKEQDLLQTYNKKDPFARKDEEKTVREIPMNYSDKKQIEEELEAETLGFKSGKEYRESLALKKQNRVKEEIETAESSFLNKNAAAKRPLYDETGEGVVFHYSSVAEQIQREAKKLGAVRTHASGKLEGVFGSSIYLKKGDVEVRISNHDLPETGQRMDSNYTTRWSKEIVLQHGEILDLAKRIKTPTDFRNYVESIFED